MSTFKTMFTNIFTFRECLLKHNQTAFDIPIHEEIIDYFLFCVVKNSLHQTEESKKFLEFCEKTKVKYLFKKIVTDLEPESELEGFINAVKEKPVAVGTEGAVAFVNDNAVKLFCRKTEEGVLNFDLTFDDLETSQMITPFVMYLILYSIFKETIDYTRHLNRIKRCFLVKTKDGFYNHGYIATRGKILFPSNIVGNPRKFAGYMIEVADAIEGLIGPLEHLVTMSKERGVTFVHGDLKIDNVVQGVNNTPEIIDFGFCSVNILFGDGFVFNYFENGSADSHLEKCIHIDIFVLVSSVDVNFFGKNEFDFSVLDDRLTEIPKKFDFLHNVIYTDISDFYKKNDFDFEIVKRNIIDRELSRITGEKKDALLKIYFDL